MCASCACRLPIFRREGWRQRCWSADMCWGVQLWQRRSSLVGLTWLSSQVNNYYMFVVFYTVCWVFFIEGRCSRVQVSVSPGAPTCSVCCGRTYTETWSSRCTNQVHKETFLDIFRWHQGRALMQLFVSFVLHHLFLKKIRNTGWRCTWEIPMRSPPCWRKGWKVLPHALWLWAQFSPPTRWRLASSRRRMQRWFKHLR